MTQSQILLAYGERGFSKKLKDTLEKGGYRVAILMEGDPPKARYDVIFQLARDPANVAEGTRLLLNKAKKDQSRLFFVGWRLGTKLYEEAARFAQTLLEESSRKNEAEIAILNLGRIYGPEVDPAESEALGHLITEFAQGNVLTLYGDGEDKDYYLFLEDALEGLALAPEHAQSGETYALTPSIPITSETAAQLLFELGGGRHEIVSHRGLSASAEKGKVAGKPLPEFKIKTSFHDGILAILKTAPAAPAASSRKLLRFHFPFIVSLSNLSLHLPRLTWKTPRPSRRRLTRIGIALLILSPLLYLVGEAGFSYYQLNRIKSAFLSLDFPRAQVAAAAASSSLERLSKLFPTVQPLAEIFQAAQEVGAQGTVLMQALENLIKSRRGEEVTPQDHQDFQAAQAAFSSSEQHLTLAWLAIPQIETKFPQIPVAELQEILGEGIKIARMATSFLGEAEELLGYKGERSYLLLFQNSAELQPGGGRMGTFAQLTLENGGIKDLKFFNESDFKHVSSPLGSFNGISKLPDFADGARAIADIFLRGDGKQVQGVVGVDLRFAQELLGITGPLVLVDFDNQEVTAENFFEVTTREVETDFFPGTTKKKRFIQALGEGVLNKFFTAGQGSYSAMAKLVWESLKGKELLLYFTNPTIYLSALENNFAGRIQETDEDYLYPFDHNVGNKGTVWVERSINYRVYNTNREGALRAELKITWKNEGTEAWPGGNYLNKTAALVPQGSKLVEARRGEENVLSNFSAGTFKERTLFSTPYKISTYTTVAPQSEQTLILVYDLPEQFNLKNLTQYKLLVQKQPGTIGDGFRFEFEEPLGYEAQSPDLQKVDNKFIFEGNLTQDLEFEIDLNER